MKAGPRLIDRIAATIAHLFYRVDVVGTVPTGGPLLLLPNHPNALLDPALIMATAGRPVRFLAKSTLFAGPFRPLLAMADAIPVYRKQDGIGGSNDQTFAAVSAALQWGEAVCVFPEGISHSSGRLEPLRTGAARMALSAAAAGVQVYLVPIGINLERKTAFRSRATVAYGVSFPAAGNQLPITTIAPHDDGPDGLSDRAVKYLTQEIAVHMRALLVEADPVTDAELVARVNNLYASGRAAVADPEADLARRKAIADAIHRLRAERPDWYESAIVQLRRYDERLRRFSLTEEALDWDSSGAAARRFIAREVPRAIFLVPVAVGAVAVFALPYALTALASRITRDTDVTATAKVVAGAGIYSAWIAVLAAAAWSFAGPLAGASTLAGLPLFAIGGLFAAEREAAALKTVRSWLALRGTHRTTRAALRRRRAELADVIDRVNVWITTEASGEAAPGDHIR